MAASSRSMPSGIAGQDHHQLVPVVLGALQQHLQRLVAVRVALAVAGVGQRVRLVHEQHARRSRSRSARWPSPRSGPGTRRPGRPAGPPRGGRRRAARARRRPGRGCGPPWSCRCPRGRRRRSAASAAGPAGPGRPAAAAMFSCADSALTWRFTGSRPDHPLQLGERLVQQRRVGRAGRQRAGAAAPAASRRTASVARRHVAAGRTRRSGSARASDRGPRRRTRGVDSVRARPRRRPARPRQRATAARSAASS